MAEAVGRQYSADLCRAQFGVDCGRTESERIVPLDGTEPYNVPHTDDPPSRRQARVLPDCTARAGLLLGTLKVRRKGSLPMDHSLTLRLQLTNAVARFQVLLALDQLWTTYLAEVEEIPRKEQEQLDNLGRVMMRQIEETRDVHADIRDAAMDRFRAEMETRRRLEEGGLLETAHGRAALAWVERRGGLFGVGYEAALRWREVADEERLAIDRKRDAISRGEFVRGDLKYRCVALASAIGAALAAQLWETAASLFITFLQERCWTETE